jgi:alginate O-acetyltransferase complex protein AlgJ
VQAPAEAIVHAEVIPIGGTYNRATSLLMARRILRPTRANLDFAAYNANVMTYAPDEDPPSPALAMNRATLFGQSLVMDSLTGSLRDTPLTLEEKQHPIAFAPMLDRLSQAKAEATAGLETARTGVAGETWGLPPRPGRPFQQITTLYLHRGPGAAATAWVKIEFPPGSGLFDNMPDDDGDGFPEVYAQLRPELFSSQALGFLQQDYLTRTLSTKEVHTWANELASYWYPSHNTDIVPLGRATEWPMDSTEAAVKQALSTVTIHGPTIVVRGKPQGKPVYNVFVVDGIASLAGRGQSKVEDAADPRTALVHKLKEFPVTVELQPTQAVLERELRDQGGGSWTAWQEQVAPLHRELRRQLDRRPKQLHALLGADGFLFYRRSLQYVVGGDIQAQPAGKNPLPALVEFKNYLAALGVDLLVVPVPSKPEVFPDKLKGAAVPPAKLPVLNPYGRKFLLELTQAGVEVIDLLPVFLKARGKDADETQLLYQRQDTHWTDRGLRLAAATVAERIKRYPWYLELAPHAVDFGTKPCDFRRPGDLHSRLSPAEQRAFKPEALVAQQVLTPAGEPFEDDADSPIVVLGDSFTGVFERTDCGSAGVSAHLARELRYPVDLVMSYGGGPNVRNTLLTRGEAALRRMRLVVWIFAARDLYNYWDDWEPLAAPKR